MKVEYKLNARELNKLIEWKAQINDAKLKTLEHPYQYYSPFVKIDDVNSISRRHLHYCQTQKRLIHLLSDGEARAYKWLIHQKDVIGIREQFPLHLPDTMRIASELDVLHPRNWKTKEVYVMTTDFLVDRVDFETGEIFQEAINYKYWDQIYEYSDTGFVIKKCWRTWQKAKIEEAFWLEKLVTPIQMTDRDASKIAVQNITWFQIHQHLDVNDSELTIFKKAFIQSYLSNPRSWLEEHLLHASKALKRSVKDAQAMFQFAAYHHELGLNIELPIRLAKPLVVNL